MEINIKLNFDAYQADEEPNEIWEKQVANQIADEIRKTLSFDEKSLKERFQTSEALIDSVIKSKEKQLLQRLDSFFCKNDGRRI